jgi:hypothetical protein
MKGEKLGFFCKLKLAGKYPRACHVFPCQVSTITSCESIVQIRRYDSILGRCADADVISRLTFVCIYMLLEIME